MTIQILKPKILGVLIPAIAVGIFFGVPLIPMTASAAGDVPEWFKGVAGFWAEEKITTAEFLDGIEFLIDQEIIQVPGFIQAADAQGVDQATISDLWTAINNMQSQMNDIQSNGGGGQGPPGPEGPAGPAGPPGPGLPDVYTRVSSVDIDPNEVESAVAACDNGDTRIGGGVDGSVTQISALTIVSNGPTGDNSWLGAAKTDFPAPVQMDTIVICLDTNP